MGPPYGTPVGLGGGLIRDANGAWIRGYARAIGQAISVAAELWTFRDGIQLCIYQKKKKKLNTHIHSLVF